MYIDIHMYMIVEKGEFKSERKGKRVGNWDIGLSILVMGLIDFHSERKYVQTSRGRKVRDT